MDLIIPNASTIVCPTCRKGCCPPAVGVLLERRQLLVHCASCRNYFRAALFIGGVCFAGPLLLAMTIGELASSGRLGPDEDISFQDVDDAIQTMAPSAPPASRSMFDFLHDVAGISAPAAQAMGELGIEPPRQLLTTSSADGDRFWCPITNRPIRTLRWHHRGQARYIECSHCGNIHSESEAVRFDPELSRQIDAALVAEEAAPAGWWRIWWRRLRRSLERAIPAAFVARKRGRAA